MKTYLLTWNPKKYEWVGMEEDAERINSAENLTIDTWSCGNNKRIMKGDRIFLLRQGEEPRGIIAAGWAVGSSYEAPHWDEKLAAMGRTTRHVNIKFSNLLIPGRDKIIGREILKADEFCRMHWNTQTSGVTIPEDIAKSLEKLWYNVVKSQLGHVNENNPTEGQR